MKLTYKKGALGVTVVALALFTLGGTAAAQDKRTPASAATTTTATKDYVEQNVSGDQVVKFTGDELAGGNGGPGTGLLIRATGPIRVGLIRPRLNFVPELLKTVENL